MSDEEGQETGREGVKTETSEDVSARSAGAASGERVEDVRTVVVGRASRRADKRAVVAIVAIVAVASAALLLWWLSRESEAGRPVPAPRTIGVEQGGAGETTTTTAATEETLRLAPEMAARAGIKIETVGERLEAGAGVGQVATGVVQANAYRSTPVVSLVGGIVRQVSAEAGQEVRKGQTVAVVLSDELAQAQSRYLAMQADLEEHHKHHHRTMALAEIGAASREELEQATTKLKTAEAEIASARQRLLLLGLTPGRVGALRSPSQISSEVALPAPVSGTVISRAANPGEVVEANKELLRVTDLSSVWVVAQVYEKDLARVRTGSGASVTSDAYPGRVFRGRVSYVDPTIEQATRTAQVRVELANPGAMLKIGMFVNVAFATLGGSETTVPVVPAAAVQNINNQQVVFVATADPNVFTLRPVRLGSETNGFYPVLEGLFVGERIATEGSFMLRAEWLKLHPTGQR